MTALETVLYRRKNCCKVGFFCTRCGRFDAQYVETNKMFLDSECESCFIRRMAENDKSYNIVKRQLLIKEI